MNELRVKVSVHRGRVEAVPGCQLYVHLKKYLMKCEIFVENCCSHLGRAQAGQGEAAGAGGPGHGGVGLCVGRGGCGGHGGYGDLLLVAGPGRVCGDTWRRTRGGHGGLAHGHGVPPGGGQPGTVQHRVQRD